MHTLNSLLFSLLAPSAVLAVAIPVTPANSNQPSNIQQQAPQCYNAPGHKAGTPLNARSLSLSPSLPASAPSSDSPDLTRRAPAPAPATPPPTTWCSPLSSTYLTLTYTSPLPATAPYSPAQFLLGAHDILLQKTDYAHNGGTPIPSGHWEFHMGGLTFSVQSAAGHAMTFAVAERAAKGVYEYSTGFLASGGWAVGGVTFGVWDGFVHVGTGALSEGLP